jgi:hypothetical protein
MPRLRWIASAIALLLLLDAPPAGGGLPRCKGTKVPCPVECLYPDECSAKKKKKAKSLERKKKRKAEAKRKKAARKEREKKAEPKHGSGGGSCDFDLPGETCGWLSTTKTIIETEQLNGNFRLTNVTSGGSACHTYSPLEGHEDFEVSARVTMPKNGSGRGGIVFGRAWNVSEKEKFFCAVMLDASGKWNIWRYRDQVWHRYHVENTKTLSLHGYNTIKLRLRGSKLTVWLNGVRVGTKTIDRPPIRAVGFYLDAPDVTMDVDWVKIADLY